MDHFCVDSCVAPKLASVGDILSRPMRDPSLLSPRKANKTQSGSAAYLASFSYWPGVLAPESLRGQEYISGLTSVWVLVTTVVAEAAHTGEREREKERT